METAMKTSLLANPQLSYRPPNQQKMPTPVTSYQQTASQSQQASIFIKTKEGDTVRISENFATMQKTAQLDYGNDLGLLASELSSNHSEFLQVQGDLNTQELADLGSLLGDLSNIAGDFFNGNFDDAVAGAMKIGDMGSLAKLDASFTNNTFLATTLAGHHPMPAASSNLFNDLMAQSAEKNDAQSPEDALSVNDRLKAQWQQFLDYLEGQVGNSSTEHNHPKHHKHGGGETKGRNPGQAMLARAKETLISQPRLSPFVPAIADLALDKAVPASDVKHARHDLIKEMKHNFRDAFQSWMV